MSTPGPGHDPLLVGDWVTDPWDEPGALPEDAFEEEPPSFDGARGPLRSLVMVLIVTVLLTGLAGRVQLVDDPQPGEA
ncbi:MAG: hypothetical protein ACKORY_14000, partial [Actinomycetota bacterium]